MHDGNSRPENPSRPETGELYLPPAKWPWDEAALPPHLRKQNYRRSEASEVLLLVFGLRVASATLAKLACIGGGPPFYRANRSPLYPREPLHRWAVARIGPLVRSSSDVGDKAA